MNARILLLMLVTGLFVTAWNGDQASRQEYLAQQLHQRPASTVVRTSNDRITSNSPLAAGHMQTSIRNERHVVTPFRPDGMVDGDYRAVSETGATFELKIDNSTNAGSRDFYVADSPAGTRWYFVRINSSN
ncbi:MAG: hypothetical protein MK102_04530 [Fuerstiella sp.]|nr:hypothetical protein [Fuerstiella sp.]